MSNGNDREEWKLVCMPPAGLRERIDMAREIEAERQGCKLSSITYQYLIPILLKEALDARRVPRTGAALEVSACAAAIGAPDPNDPRR